MFHALTKATWQIPHYAELDHVENTSHDLTSLYSEVVNYLLALPRGSLLILLGDLGLGKTSLVKALVSSLGSEARVHSPTYTLIHEYPTSEGVVVHVDAYKYLPHASGIMDVVPTVADTLLQFGLEEYLSSSRLLIVEWGASLIPLFPDAYVLTLSMESEQRQLNLYSSRDIRNEVVI